VLVHPSPVFSSNWPHGISEGLAKLEGVGYSCPCGMSKGLAIVAHVE
jgi:hypothetical protein